MAWRIDEYVIRGEIDNRIRGRVIGRIWFAGRAEPVELNLAGNAWRDLAGRRLEFVNPAPKLGLDGSFAAQQHGKTGDITASRKVKVPEIPHDQIGEYYIARKPWPWHWGNSLYFEWLSHANGRVVIESASYQLTVSPDAVWEMTPAEEATQHLANAAALGDFMQSLDKTIHGRQAPADDGHRPQTEAEAEKMQAESDQLVDRIMARMDRAENAADYEKILNEEIERARRERGEPDPTPEQEAERNEWIEEMNAAATEALKEKKSEAWKHGSDATHDAFGHSHPLTAQAFALSVRVMRETTERRWIPEDAVPEHPVLELVTGISKAGAKLAAALDDDDWPPPLEFCAVTIVRLKKAAGYLEDAQLAARSCREESLTDPPWLDDVTRETANIAAATTALIDELRTRLKHRD